MKRKNRLPWKNGLLAVGFTIFALALPALKFYAFAPHYFALFFLP